MLQSAEAIRLAFRPTQAAMAVEAQDLARVAAVMDRFESKGP